jgi:hypothetical protein
MKQDMSSKSSSEPLLTPMDRVRRIAGLMRGMVLVGGTAFSAFTLLIWVFPSWIRSAVPHELGLDLSQITITPAAQIRGAVVSLLPLGLSIYGLVQVWLLFGEYAQGRIFTAMASKRLRRLAWTLIAAAGAQILARTLHGLVLTMNNPPGQKLLILNFSSNDYTFLIFGVLLLGIAWVMVEATRLAQENAEFV